MKTIPFGKSGLQVPAIALGCMRLTALDEQGAQRYVRTALDLGANFFDHADIYGGGACEELFGKAIAGIPRDQLIIQSKCGIVPGKRYDFSKEYILNAVDGILQRLGIDYLDALLLHRPDALMDPVEVAEAFATLKAAGKVNHFGVSNQNPYQMALLQKTLPMPIVANQLQLSVTNCTMITQGMEVNMATPGAVGRDGGVLDYCRLHDITIQPWSPFQYGFFEGVFIGSDKYPELNKKLDEIAEKYGVTATTIAVAWLLRHPANFQPIIGTMNITRLAECVKACDVQLTRQEWYDIYLSAGNILP
ncbi:MAG: aldo/keto reductase [Candidatus Spyradocola sp.]|nr:aldo/keto reductase [Candidatus Spyradocola sp.]